MVVIGLTFASTTQEDRASSRWSRGGLDVILSGIVVILIVAISLTFTG